MALEYSRSRYDALCASPSLGAHLIRRIVAISRSLAPPSARLALDQVLVAPVGTQPLKGGSAQSSFEDRLAMVRLAVEGMPGLMASSIDAPLADGQPNYTFDTLQRLRSQLQPADTLFCLLGADSFLTIRSWHRCSRTPGFLRLYRGRQARILARTDHTEHCPKEW